MNDEHAKLFAREMKALGEQLIDILKRTGEAGPVPFPLKDCQVANIDLEAKRLPCGHQYLVVSFALADPVHKALLGLMSILEIEEIKGKNPDLEIHEGTIGKDH